MKKPNRKLMKPDDRKAWEDRVIKTYRVFKSLRETARLLGTNKDSILLTLKSRGEPTKHSQPSKKQSALAYRGNSRISDWLKRHSHRKLPRDYKHLAELIGVSHTALRSFFYRRRQKVKDALKRIPDLRLVCAMSLLASEGRLIETHEIESYRYVMDRFTLDVTISVVLKTGEQYFCPIDDLQDFVTAVETYSRKEAEG